MGIITSGPPTELVLRLKEEFSISDFVETGTFSGGTSTWAASHFEQVTTIENSRKIYEQTVARHGHIPNIKFLMGNSKDLLESVVTTLETPAIFWLDSHWCGGDSYGEQEQCPLLEEIAILNASPVNHFLLIDDARLFTSPPPRPHQVEDRPPIDQVIQNIKAGPHDKYIVIIQDVILVVPRSARNLVAHWSQEVNADISKQKHIGRLKQGMGLIDQGLRLIAASALSKVRSDKS